MRERCCKEQAVLSLHPQVSTFWEGGVHIPRFRRSDEAKTGCRHFSEMEAQGLGTSQTVVHTVTSKNSTSSVILPPLSCTHKNCDSRKRRFQTTFHIISSRWSKTYCTPTSCTRGHCAKANCGLTLRRMNIQRPHSKSNNFQTPIELPTRRSCHGSDIILQ